MVAARLTERCPADANEADAGGPNQSGEPEVDVSVKKFRMVGRRATTAQLRWRRLRRHRFRLGVFVCWGRPLCLHQRNR
jgi:hypothetical protein